MRFEAWCAFVAVRILAVGDRVCWNLRLRATVPVEGGLVLDCSVMCENSDVLLCCTHKIVVSKRCPIPVGCGRHSLPVR